MAPLLAHAGPRALALLRQRGLRPEDVRIVPAAAGGPKGLVLVPLDQFIFGEWLAGTHHPVHLFGASIGAWRMACACLRDPAAALAQMAHDYIHQTYVHTPGKLPTRRHVSEVFGANLQQRLTPRAAELLTHPRYRLHVFTSRGRHLLRREGRVLSSISNPLAHFGAFAANAVSRRALSGFWERVVFSDAREPLPFKLHDYRTRYVELAPNNLGLSILASCSIPYWLDAVHDIPGAPRGAYVDGGITDYHLHLNYASMGDGLVLYPHFQRSIVPGWLDKFFAHRHRATAMLANVVVLSPNPAWVARLPGGKLPDRDDFTRYGDDTAARISTWTRAVHESERLRDAFTAMVAAGPALDVQPLL